MIDSIPFENMGYQTSGFPLRETSKDVDDIHPTQKGRHIKLILLFLVPQSMDNGITPVNETDQRPHELPRIAYVRVPKGCPVFKLRILIRYIEMKLNEIYGRGKRLNFVLTCEEGSDNWTYQYDLPSVDVVYI